MEFKCSDGHKRAMNFIYQRPLYPEVWEDTVKVGEERKKTKLKRRTTKLKRRVR